MAGRWLTPASAPPAGSIYKLIRLPAEVDWQAPFWGALIELAKSHNWEQLSGETPEDTADVFADLFTEWRMPNPLIGTIFVHASSSQPPNSLPCDGSTYNRSDYPDLYDALDAAYRVGSTQLTVPDLRGRTLICDGQGSGLTNRAFAATGGNETVTLLQSQIPSHTHGDNGHSHGESQAVPAIGAAITGVPVPSAVPGAGLTAVSYASLTNTGGGGSHTNMQPWLALHYAIWAK